MIKDPKENPEYYAWLQKWASTNSDGCTGVPDIHVACCWQHDFSYQMGLDPREYWQGRLVPLSKGETDKLFRLCNESEDKLGRFSPLAWWRWLGVKLFGHGSWKGSK